MSRRLELVDTTTTERSLRRLHTGIAVSRITTTILILALLIVPLAKGGYVVSVQALHAIAVVLAVVYQYLIGQGPEKAGPWLVPWAVLSTYIAFQIALGWISPDPFETLAHAEPGAPVLKPGYFPNTIHMGYALSYWASFSIYWITAWLVASMERRAVRWVLAAVVALAAFESLYGLIVFAAGQETILGIWPKQHYLQDVTGTFVNRNHFAGLLAVCLPLGTAFLFASRRGGGFDSPRPVRYASAALYAVVVGLAIANSHSRLGLASALIGVTAWFWLLSRSTEFQNVTATRWAWIAMVCAIVLAALWFGPLALTQRFMRLPDATSRYDIWLAMLEFPLSAWVTGIGAGAFVDAFPLVQPGNLQKQFDQAHNDWLQFLFELGLCGALATGLALIYWFRKSRPKRFTFVQLAAAGSMIAIAVHSLGDFNLQIRGSALVFWIAVGIFMNPNLANANAKRGPPPRNAEWQLDARSPFQKTLKIPD